MVTDVHMDSVHLERSLQNTWSIDVGIWEQRCDFGSSGVPRKLRYK